MEMKIMAVIIPAAFIAGLFTLFFIGALKLRNRNRATQGFKLESQAIASPVPPQITLKKSSTNYCNGCGSYLISNVKFCSNCGFQIPEFGDQPNNNNEDLHPASIYPESPNQNLEQPQKGKSPGTKGISIVWLILFLAMSAAAIGFAIYSNSEKLSESWSGSNSVFEANLFDKAGDSCSANEDSSLSTCTVSINVTNISDVAQTLYGTIYAVADGKVYRAATWLGGIDIFSDTLNPGITKGAVLNFDIPIGSTITQIFASSDADPNSNNVVLSLELDLLAADS
jgi:flagellar basal body-associated protein FliL